MDAVWVVVIVCNMLCCAFALFAMHALRSDQHQRVMVLAELYFSITAFIMTVGVADRCLRALVAIGRQTV